MEGRTRRVSVILGVGLLAVSAAVATAQQPSITKTTQMGQAETTTSTRTVNATVVSVDGNKVVGKDAAGKHTEYTIPDGFKFQYQGREIGVSELKPGMQVSAKITTTTTMTPVYVTEIRTGKVLAVSGDHIIVKGPQGNRQFSNADAEEAECQDLRATGSTGRFERPAYRRQLHGRDRHGRGAQDRLRSRSPGHSQRRRASAGCRSRSGSAAPAPAAAPAPEPAPAPAALPKTASQVPVAGLMGMLSIAAAVGLTLLRRKR